MEGKSKESEEKKIPVLTVFKKGLMFKNIFLLDNTTSPLLTSNTQSLNSVDPKDGIDEGDEEVLVVGRHPDCSIVLEHPSISRFHLRIYLQPSRQKLFVVDLSSAHGTWVTDRKIEPQIRVELNEGDILRLGVSTRSYRLHWVSLSHVFDVENPLVPQNLETLVLAEKKEEEGVLDSEDLNPVEQHLGPLSHVFDDENSLGLPNSENQLPLEESEECGVLQIENPISFERHLCPLDCVFNVENPVVLPNSESLVLPEVKEEKGVLENENLNSAEQNLSPLCHGSGDENSLLLPSDEIKEGGVLENENSVSFGQHLSPSGHGLNVENLVDSLNSKDEEHVLENENLNSKALVLPEGKDEERVLENQNLNSAEQHLSPLRTVFDDKNKLSLSNSENELPLEEIDEVNVLENKHPISFEHHLCSLAHVLEAENPPDMQLHLSGAFNSENTLDSSYFESSVSPEEGVEGMSDNEVLISSEQHLNPMSCGFDVESPLVSLSSENILLPEEREVTGVLLTNGNPISFGQHLSPSAPPLLNFTEEILLSSSNCVDELGLESASSSSLPNNFAESVQSVADYQEAPQHRLETPSLWSRRGKPPSLIRIATACSIRKTMDVARDDKNESDNPNKMEDESVTKVLFSGSEAEEESFTSDNENYTPKREAGLELVEKWKSGEVELRWSYGSLSSTQSEDKGMSTFSEKENLTPVVSHNSRLRKPLSESRLGQEADMIMSKRMEGRMPFQCLVVNSDNSKSEARAPVTDTTTNSSVNCARDELTPKVLFSCSDKEEEIFTPCKENWSPKAGLGSQSIEKEMSVELEHEKSCGSLTSSDIKEKLVQTLLEKENPTQVVLHDSGIDKPISASQEAEIIVSERSAGRVAFQEGCKSVPVCDKQSYRNENKRWYMLVDTNCLLNKESRRSLQLLQGLKGTQLIIPRMVIRELDCLQKRGGLLRKAPEASAVLEWIEECTVKTKFWIHVQSSNEEPIASTPPASPRWLTWLSEEVCSPTAEDRVLDCALLVKRTKKDDGYVVLLSNDIALKIKAMEKGMLCETANEFRESLVNPYSERFLWVGSIPRGPTWSCLEEPGLRENCCNVPVKKIVFKAAEGAKKGLKLLLFHNYLNSRQMISVS